LGLNKNKIFGALGNSAVLTRRSSSNSGQATFLLESWRERPWFKRGNKIKVFELDGIKR